MPRLLIFVAVLAGLGACDADPSDDNDDEGVLACAPSYIADGDRCIPESCGTGTWGDLEVDETTIFVDATAPDEGDGSEASPLRTIQPALDLAGSRGGGLVAVAAGTYAETLHLTTDHGGTQLAGRCRELVTLDGSGAEQITPGIWIQARYGELEVSGLTVRGSTGEGIVLESGVARLSRLSIEGSAYAGLGAAQDPPAPTNLEVSDCELIGNRFMGVLVYDTGTVVSLSDTTIRGTLPDDNGDYGIGIDVFGGATLSAERCTVEGNSGEGVVSAQAGTEVTLVDLTIRDTLPDASGGVGHGIQVTEGARLTAEGCLLVRNSNKGIKASGSGSEIIISRTTVRDTQSHGSGEGVAFQVSGGAMFEAAGCLLEGNTSAGCLFIDEGTTARLEDTTIRNTSSDGDGEYGFGINVHGGAQLSAQGCVLEGNSAAGLLVSDPVTRVSLQECVIRGTRPNGNGVAGFGVSVEDGAALEARGCLVDGNSTQGLQALDPGTSVALVDTVIRGTLPHTTDTTDTTDYGVAGVTVQDGATLAGHGCVLEDNSSGGVVAAHPNTTVALTGSSIMGTQPDPDGSFGQGIDVWGGARLESTGCTLEGNTGAGLKAAMPGTEVRLADTDIRGTRPDGGGAYGFGLDVSSGTQLSADGCLLDDNMTAGVLATDPGTHVALRNTIITGTTTTHGELGAVAIGLFAQEGASVSAPATLIQGNEGPGLYSIGTAQLACADCTLADNRFGGAVAIAGGVLELSSTSISGTVQSVDLGGGVGVYAAPQWDLDPPSLRITDSVLTDNLVAGAFIVGEGSYQLEDNTISGSLGVAHGLGTRCGDGVYAAGITAWDGTSGLLLDNNTIHDNTGAGLFLDDAAAVLTGNSWSDNDPDLLVQGEACLEPLDAYAEAPTSDVCPTWDRPACDLLFHLNLATDRIDPELRLPTAGLPSAHAARFTHGLRSVPAPPTPSTTDIRPKHHVLTTR